MAAIPTPGAVYPRGRLWNSSGACVSAQNQPEENFALGVLPAVELTDR